MGHLQFHVDVIAHGAAQNVQPLAGNIESMEYILMAVTEGLAHEAEVDPRLVEKPTLGHLLECPLGEDLVMHDLELLVEFPLCDLFWIKQFLPKLDILLRIHHVFQKLECLLPSLEKAFDHWE